MKPSDKPQVPPLSARPPPAAPPPPRPLPPICTYGSAKTCYCPECSRHHGADEERAAIVRRLELHADGLEIEARKIPHGQARNGGPLDDAPEFSIAMIAVNAWRAAAKLARGGA
jgi:hypothetical protein